MVDSGDGADKGNFKWHYNTANPDVKYNAYLKMYAFKNPRG